MLRDTKLMLEKAISMGHSAEETNKHTKELAQDEGGNHIDMIQHGQQQSIINQCWYCSRKKGHFASCCCSINSNTEKKKFGKINNLSKVENQSDSERGFFIGAIL